MMCQNGLTEFKCDVSTGTVLIRIVCDDFITPNYSQLYFSNFGKPFLCKNFVININEIILDVKKFPQFDLLFFKNFFININEIILDAKYFH